MKKNLLLLFAGILFYTTSFAQFGIWAGAAWMYINGTAQFYNASPLVTADPTNAIGSVDFTDTSFGNFPQNSGLLNINGGEIKTYKNSNGNVCSGTLYFTVYPTGSRPASPVFTPINLPWFSDCGSGTFTVGGGPCSTGDQKWQSVAASNDLTQLPQGNYTLEIYFQVTGDPSCSSCCDQSSYLNNSAANFTASFTITAPLAINFSGLSGNVSGNTIQLKWNIQDDGDITQYEVQKSTDGSTFSTLAEIPSQQSAGTAYYSTVDDNPSVGSNYYRVVFYNQSGTVTYSRIISVNYQSGGNIQVFPVGNNTVLLQLNSVSTGKYNFIIYNNLGQKMSSNTFIYDGSQTTYLFQTTGYLAKGIYRAELWSSENMYTKSFLNNN